MFVAVLVRVPTRLVLVVLLAVVSIVNVGGDHLHLPVALVRKLVLVNAQLVELALVDQTANVLDAH